MPEQIQKDSGIDRSGASAHHQAFERREAHGGIHAFARRAWRRATLHFRGGRTISRSDSSAPQQLRGAAGCILVIDAVKSVAADAVIEPFVRAGINIRGGRQGGMESGVKDGDLPDTGAQTRSTARLPPVRSDCGRERTGPVPCDRLADFRGVTGVDWPDTSGRRDNAMATTAILPAHRLLYRSRAKRFRAGSITASRELLCVAIRVRGPQRRTGSLGSSPSGGSPNQHLKLLEPGIEHQDFQL